MHLQHLSILFDKLKEADLKLKEIKCNFLKEYVQYLGHIVSDQGIEPVPEKLGSVRNMLTLPKKGK